MHHPKIAGLSDGAFRLWIQGLAYCQMFLTDGYISEAAQRGLTAFSPKRKSLLVDGKLWDVSETGVRVHDFLDWNESREHILAARQFAKDRMSRFRDKKRVTNGEVTHSANSEATATHTTPPTPPTPPTHEPRAARTGHRQHAFCGRNFCVSFSQHDLLMRELGSARASVDLVAKYPDWDALEEPIDNLLPWLKGKIRSLLQANQPQVSKLTAALEKASQW